MASTEKNLLDRVHLSIAGERYAFRTLRESNEAKDLEESQQVLLKSIRDAGRAGDLSLLVSAEKSLVEEDLAYYSNSKPMKSSLMTALNEIRVIERHIGLVDDPVRYRVVDEAYSLPRNRKGGLPNDEARQALRSHYARLNNLDKARLSDVEKHIIDARKSNILQAEKHYKERQARALAVGNQPSPGKATGL